MLSVNELLMKKRHYNSRTSFLIVKLHETNDCVTQIKKLENVHGIINK